MTTDTSTTLVAMGDVMSSSSGSPGVTAILLMLLIGVALPLMSMAFVFMLPLRAARKAGRGAPSSAAAGLGDRTLHEEFWEFIDAVESGKVTLSDVPATADRGDGARSS